MIVDTSAIVAVVLREPGFQAVVDRLEGDEPLAVGAPTLTEAALVLSARLDRDARPKLARLLQEYEIAVVPFAAAHWDEATEAFLRFGKGRHPAALNYGDCMSYAVAKLADQPLLCLGRDFVQTDLGTGSPNSVAVSIQRAMASCACASASCGVSPCAMQPGNSGTSAMKS